MKQNNPPKTISIIIPVLNEEGHIGVLLSYLKHNSNSQNIKEIIVVDGGSRDRTLAIAKEADVKILHSEKGRAKQMNYGAKHAEGDVFYFLHVDTLPPKHFDVDILNSIEENAEAGCFRMKFDSKNKILRIFAWFTRINHKICRGGDQSLFVSKPLFQETKGFNEAYKIYEDTEFISRLYNSTKFTVLPRTVVTSARKYEEKGTVKLQYHFGVIHVKKHLGAGPEELYAYYKRKIAS